MSAVINCRECITKQEEIYRLKEEVKSLKAKLRYPVRSRAFDWQDRQITEGYYGSSTPSSKKPYKENSKTEKREKNRGGARPGHKGNGRQKITREDADRVEYLSAPCSCPKCEGEDLEALGERERAVYEFVIKTEKVLYLLERKRCNGCHHLFQAKAPGVLPRNLYSNNLLAHIASEHYLNGIPLGHPATAGPALVMGR